jgi:hypothetical protein
MTNELKYSDADMLRLIQDLMNYTRDGHVILGYDERTPQEFLNIFNEKQNDN